MQHGLCFLIIHLTNTILSDAVAFYLRPEEEMVEVEVVVVEGTMAGTL